MFIRCTTALFAVAVIQVPAWTQTSSATLIDLRTQARDVDFSTFSFTRPVATGAALPTTCQVGQLFFDTAANAGSNLYACTATNTWMPQGASGGNISSISWGTLPSWLSGIVANATSTPSLTLTAANGQATHQVLGTGTGSAFVPISLTAADLPLLLTSNTTGTAANVTGTVALANGGTGQTTASAAFNALSPLTTLGDLLYGAGSGAGTRLAGNTATIKKFLTQTGTGTVSAAPAWGAIAASDLPLSITSSTSGNAATATQFASAPTGCASGFFSTGVTALGNANCTQVSYAQLSGTPSLYNQTLQVNGTAQTQAAALNLVAGSNVTLSGSTAGGTTTLTINSIPPANNVTGPGASTNYALPFWNGTSGSVLGNSQVTTDASGDVSASGTVSANTFATSGSGAGTIMLSQGSRITNFTANSAGLYAPASIPTAYQWVLPASDGAGAIVSDGNGTPGHLSIAKVMTQVTAPNAAGQSCTANTYAIDSSNYFYYCLAAGTWVRTQMTGY